MALVPGTRLGVYEILSPLGAGGMGEVYQAKDTRLKRDVAIKVLPDTFAQDVDRLARFQREAELLATLNHPNIAGIYGLEESNGVRALVLELVEGPTLADRIAKGPIPLDEALPVARQIADALEAAHEKGVIHRDLKPANIKVTTDGTVKVLDFGLAKLAESPAVSGAVGLSQSPTITTPAMMTRIGMILGTAAYMSPEQAKGRQADKRSDVWAFGCVLYEMLTGKRVFEGEHVSDMLADVLKSEPAWTSLPSKTPPALRRLLHRCLAKDPKQRLSEIGTARLEIDEILHPPSHATDFGVQGPRARGTPRLAWAAVGALLLVSLALGAVTYGRRASAGSAPVPEMRVEITTPPDSSLNRFALSPDGTKFVYEQAGMLWLRSLASENPQRLTEGGSFPFWSPDSQSIGFFHGGQLKRLDLSSGLVQALAKAPLGMGGTWSADGTILYVPSHSSPAFRISAGRGGAEPMRLAAGQIGQRFPQFLPDGRHFLYLAMGTPNVRGIYVGSLDSPETHRLFESDSQAVFAPPDSVLFQRQGALLAQRIDLGSLTLVGDAAPVATRVAVVGASYNAVAVTASATERLAYRPNGALRQLVWIDRKGQRIASLGDPDDVRPYNVTLSPDGRAVALDRTVEGDTDVWVIDTDRGTRRRLTHGRVRSGGAVWSPDGRRIAFASERTGVFAIYEMPADGSGSETLVSSSSEPRVPGDWSADGRFLLFLQQSPEGGGRDWILPLTGDGKPVSLGTTPFQRGDGGVFSPDSHWIAYSSNETGRDEVYVRQFPARGAALQVSTRGGSSPLWPRRGRELLYLDGNRVMSVPIALGGEAPEVGMPIVLFELTNAQNLYDASSDGQRFLVLEDTEPPAPITLILNWAGPRR